MESLADYKSKLSVSQENNKVNQLTNQKKEIICTLFTEKVDFLLPLSGQFLTEKISGPGCILYKLDYGSTVVMEKSI